jgi:flagellar hook-length control protein FliK
MAGSELTRAAGIILRDGGGEIRLVLRPESLGSLRVRLNLTDNGIDGKIIVDNPAVKHIVEASIDSLTRALSADGFQTASLQVSVGGGGGGAAREDREVPAVRRIESVRGFAAATAEAETADWGDLLVNLFA